MLFNEAEVLAAIAATESQASSQTYAVDAHERKKEPGRKAVPEKFPRQQVLHDIPEDEKVGWHADKPLVRIGEEISERYEYTPPRLVVIARNPPSAV
jgi:transposase